ncbi:hypothetical protein [Tamlana sp. I1]|uniref:hypothetical protein n=1 Tax=Tamlana sp. I1 TaxID=2762061 RepID=UPI00188E0401|nr:hypothetical protein [Tamlana sp. I1]
MKKISILSMVMLSLILFNCSSTSSTTTTTTIPTTTTTTTATAVNSDNSDISDNLDLEALSSVFGESKDLEDFEKRLNDPKTQISNLDLNKDGQVDYLRVVSKDNGDEKIVTVQAVLAKDKYQDVATINVKKENSYVQVVGDPDIYGPNYYIDPVYAATPLIMSWFWGPMFTPWISPFYWGFFPPFFHPWRPFPPYIYRGNINVRINNNNIYHHSNINHHNHNLQHNHTAPHHNDLQRNELSRSDHFNSRPTESFQNRNNGIYNKNSLDMNRGGTFTRSSHPNFGGFHGGMGGMGGGFRGGGFRR